MMADLVKFAGDESIKFEIATLVDENGEALVDENNESLQGRIING